MPSRYQPTQEVIPLPGVLKGWLGLWSCSKTGNLGNAIEMPIEIIDMNVKTLTGNIPSEMRPVQQVDRAIKSDQTHDRDANGQQMFSQDQQHHEPMSDEQLEKCLDHLRNLSGVKEHNWIIELENAPEGKFVLVRDNLGTLIRRIPELELWTLETDDKFNGHLLKKTA